MNIRRLGLLLVTCAVIASGCNKTPPGQDQASIPSNPPTPVRPPVHSIASIHWLGKKQIAADTNAAVLMSVWNLPESAKFEAQTLEKISLTPWTLPNRALDTNTSALLKPLLDDMVRCESFLEIRQATNEPAQLVFAIRLDDARAGVWQTNLAAAFESLTGIRPNPATGPRPGWSLQKHHAPDLIELTRLNGWTLLSAANDHNALLDELSARIQANGAPFIARATNFWLEAELEPARVAKAFSLNWNVTTNFEKISLTEIGEGTNVHTHALIELAAPLLFASEPWNIPTNLIHSPVTSCIAVRGFKPWLASQPVWTNLQIGPPPNQFYGWGEQGLPMVTYFAAPSADASNQVETITGLVLQNSGGSIPSNSQFAFKRGRDGYGLEWNGIPYVWPFIKSYDEPGGPFIGGGFFLLPVAPNAPPPQFPLAIFSRTNLCCYDWEMTGSRVESWLHILQVFRFTTHHAQLPLKSTGLDWLKALQSKLNKSVTEIYVEGPNQLSVDRKSTVGFTGLELHLLSDWLESPQFPIGLHTFRAPPDQWPEELMSPQQ